MKWRDWHFCTSALNLMHLIYYIKTLEAPPLPPLKAHKSTLPSINTNISDWRVIQLSCSLLLFEVFHLHPASLTPFLCVCCQAFKMSRSPLGCLSAALADGMMAR